MTSDDANLTHLLRRHAQERPGALAVRTPLSVGPEGEIAHASLTFGELDRRTDAVARVLRASGIGKGTRVLLALRPGEQLLVGFHGLLKVGAVPVDRRHNAKVHRLVLARHWAARGDLRDGARDGKGAWG